eukprot:GHVQ01010955.1.p1 GENE.GHVQ01010955.1~~GHVQ01010955.1.p1  ORF type:complete len:267 (-),score=58.56 GHVQ01010955.1:94-894(-)
MQPNTEAALVDLYSIAYAPLQFTKLDTMQQQPQQTNSCGTTHTAQAPAFTGELQYLSNYSYGGLVKFKRFIEDTETNPEQQEHRGAALVFLTDYLVRLQDMIGKTTSMVRDAHHAGSYKQTSEITQAVRCKAEARSAQASADVRLIVDPSSHRPWRTPSSQLLVSSHHDKGGGECGVGGGGSVGSVRFMLGDPHTSPMTPASGCTDTPPTNAPYRHTQAELEETFVRRGSSVEIGLAVDIDDPEADHHWHDKPRHDSRCTRIRKRR